MRHRVLLIFVLTVATWATIAWSQQAERPRVIGVLALSAGPNDSVYTAVRRGLSKLGYLEGRDFRIEYRGAQGNADRLAELAQELVYLKVDLIFASTEMTTRAAKQATSTIPIVAVLPDHDPVASGLIESWNKPGGNITGLAGWGLLSSKRLQLLKEILPNLSRVSVAWDSSVSQEIGDLQTGADRLGIHLQLVEMKSPYDFDLVFAKAKRQKAGAVMLLSSPQVYVRRTQLGALALKYELPLDTTFRDVTVGGGLTSYSGDLEYGFSRSAYFIDRLLKGAKPADLPFEKNERIQFVINLKTAKALRLTIPQAVLLRADEIIR
jgi:putative ABC transport system substrate-binding protein